MKLFLFIISFLFTSSVFANNPGVSYQGRIFKPDGYPLEGSNVQFRMQVRSPGAENCLLFEEIQTINMMGSSGIFSITLNDGSGTRMDTPTYQVDRIFANRDVMTLDATRCAVGTSYTPNTGDGRKFIVYFKDETMSAYEPLPVMNLNYAPQAMYALEAQKVGTFAVNNILRAVDGSGNPVAAPALDPTQLTNLNNLLAGTSSQYATAADFSTVQTFAKAALPTCSIGEVLKANGTAFSCVTDSAGGSPAYSAITAATATNTIDNTSHAQTWNWSTATTQSPMSLSANALTTGSGLNLTTSSAALNSTNGFLNVANTGASTSGILARLQSNSTAGSGLTVLTNGNVGIGTASPSSILSFGGEAGRTFGMERRTSADSAGNSLTISAGGATAAANFKNGGDLTLTSGTATGWGTSNMYFQTVGVVGAGPTTDNTPTTKMTILGSGNVGVGTSSPQTTLQVEGIISPATNNIYTLGSATYRFTEVYATNGVINTSDRREKKDIYNTDLGLDFINKLRPVSYRWNTGVDTDIHYGLIAQETEQAIAEVRNNNSKNKTSIVAHDETTDRYGVRYSELISPLIKAAQELYNRLVVVESHQNIQSREIASKADKSEVDAKVQKLESENEKLKQENAAIKIYLCNKDKTADICK